MFKFFKKHWLSILAVIILISIISLFAFPVVKDRKLKRSSQSSQSSKSSQSSQSSQSSDSSDSSYSRHSSQSSQSSYKKENFNNTIPFEWSRINGSNPYATGVGRFKNIKLKATDDSRCNCTGDEKCFVIWKDSAPLSTSAVYCLKVSENISNQFELNIGEIDI